FALSLHQTEYELGDLKRQIWRNGIADLNVLLSSVPFKEIVVWKCLEARSLANGQAPALRGVRMDEVVAIFRDVARDGRRRLLMELDSKAIIKGPGVPA